MHSPITDNGTDCKKFHVGRKIYSSDIKWLLLLWCFLFRDENLRSEMLQA